MAQTLDCSLKSLQIPGLVSYTPTFGTKKVDGHGLTTAEINRNIMMPFMKQRPISGVPTAEGLDPPIGVIDTDTIATPIEYDANFAVNSGVKLQLADPAYEGQVVRVVASFSSGIPAEIILGVTGNPEKVLLNKEEILLLFAVNKKWQQSIINTLKPSMPLNPVCAYDMADVQTKSIFQHGYFESTGKYKAKILCDLSAYKGKTIHLTVSGYRKGDGGYPVIAIKESQIWIKYSYQDFDSLVEKTMSYTITLPLDVKNLYCALYHYPNDKMSNTIVMTRCSIETVDGNLLIDSSGHGSHATITGDAIKGYDNTVGMALAFKTGRLENAASNFIGVGKKWTHSRWIKIDGNAQKKIAAANLWRYEPYDYAIMDMASNNGVVSDVSFLCYKNEQALHRFNIKKTQLLDNQWHNLIVMTDLQESYCWRVFYLDGQKIGEKRIEANFKDFAHTVRQIEMQDVRGSLANLLFFDRLLTEAEVQWLSHSPYYPVKQPLLQEFLESIDSKVNDLLIKIFQNGYIQWAGMPSPLEDTALHFEGYSWYEVNYDGNFFRAKGRNAKAFSAKKLTVDHIKNGTYIFQDDEQGDAIRNIKGTLGPFDDGESARMSSIVSGCFQIGGRGVRDVETSGTDLDGFLINFDASKAADVSVAEENRSRNLTFTIWALVKDE